MLEQQTAPIPAPAVDFSRASIHMPTADQKALRDYFQSGGLSGCSASNWGEQLERLSRTSGGSRPCEDCGGCIETGRVGTGFQPIHRKRRRAQEKPNELLAVLMDDPTLAKVDAELPQMSGHYCQPCGGRGVTPLRAHTRPTGPVTVRPTGSSKHGRVPSITVDLDLMSVGRVLRCIAAVRLVWVDAVAVLGQKFGPDSEGESEDSLFSVYPLAPAAKKLLRKNPAGLTPIALLANEYASAVEHSDATKLLIFEHVKIQAGDLFRRACQAWNYAVHPVDPDDVEAQAEALLDGGPLS